LAVYITARYINFALSFFFFRLCEMCGLATTKITKLTEIQHIKNRSSHFQCRR